MEKGSSNGEKARPVEKTSNPTNVFMTMALDMSWRLALTVLVPIVGGFKLDEHFHTSPWLSIAGFALAMIGSGLVMWQALQAANRLPVPKLNKTQKRAIKRGYDEDDD